MTQNICPHCQATNTTKARFCNRCGKPLQSPAAITPSICPSCGVPLKRGTRFCPACGQSVLLPHRHKGAGDTTPPTQIMNRRAALEVRFPDGSIRKYQIGPQPISVGRNSSNAIQIQFPGVSGRHLQLSTRNQQVFVTDLNSTNGTEINGRSILPGQPHLLRPGDIMRIRDGLGNSIVMKLESASAMSLRTLNLGMFDLSKITRLTIGRAPENDLPLNHPTISNHHAVLERRNDILYLRDLRSTNGTFVNGQRVRHTQLNSGDIIQIGPFKLVYNAQQQQLAQSMSPGHRLDAVDLGFKVSSGKVILKEISLAIQPGEFVALVGGSGAGKSTLLKALNGFTQANQGRMLIDGESLYLHLDVYRAQMGYVPQDDIIHMDLPVHRALWYAAKLRLPDASTNEIAERIEDALQRVDMLEHAHKKVKVLSGGQRKRVSIAVELLANPTLFFLDEPTSGLDPGLEKKMMQDLSRLADEGKTVVLVTHATANIEECDHVAFLSHGCLAYFGPPREAPAFFRAMDFADIYRRLAQTIDPPHGKHAPQELLSYYQRAIAKNSNISKMVAGPLWAAHYRQSSTYQKYVSSRQQPILSGGFSLDATAPSQSRARKKAPLIGQTWILARRQMDLIRNNWITLAILLIMMPVIGALFMAVSGKYDLTGWPLSATQVDHVLIAELVCPEEDSDKVYNDIKNVSANSFPECVVQRIETVEIQTHDGTEEITRIQDRYQDDVAEGSTEYIPTQAAETLVTMLGLAITQAGTFAAAYEIIKERAIFKRERAINLRVGPYVFSKVLILSIFGLFQVASVLLILGIKLDLTLDSVTGLPNGPWELLITLFIAVLASILFGLFISAVVSNQDIVIYIILAQLFAQIILSGTLFPLPDNPVSKTTIANWTMNAMGSLVNLPELNEEARGCAVEVQELPPNGEKMLVVGCDSLAPRDLTLNYDHSADHLYKMWGGLFVHTVIWGVLTVIVLYFKKGR